MGTGPVGRPAGRVRDVCKRCLVPNRDNEAAAWMVHRCPEQGIAGALACIVSGYRRLVAPAASGRAWARGRREKRITPSLILPYRSVTTSRA